MNCIYNASLSGSKVAGSTLYVHGLPVCSDCAKGIIQSGISSVVARYAVPAIKQKDLKERALGGQVPTYKNYRRECWNVYVIPEEEIFMFRLTGNV